MIRTSKWLFTFHDYGRVVIRIHTLVDVCFYTYKAYVLELSAMGSAFRKSAESMGLNYLLNSNGFFQYLSPASMCGHVALFYAWMFPRQLTVCGWEASCFVYNSILPLTASKAPSNFHSLQAIFHLATHF